MTDARPDAPPTSRLPGLDLLRLLAILLVIGRHVGTLADAATLARHPLVSAWSRGGWVGVDVFFVLSGFLVSGLLFAEYTKRGGLSPMRFYVRRGWKIYPPFYLLIAVTVFVYAKFGQQIQLSWLLSELLFFQSYVPGLWMHSWSLGVEEHFYLLLPLVLLLFVRRNPASANPFRAIPALGLAIVAAALVARIVTWRAHPTFAYQVNLSPTHLRLDSLFMGVVLSYALHFHRDAFVRAVTPWRWPLIAAGLTLLAPAFAFPLETTPFIYTAGFTLFALGGVMLVAGTMLCSTPRTGVTSALASLGAQSYSIYLWHLPVMLWGIPLAEQSAGFRFAFGIRATLSVVASIGVGVMMAKLVERPALRLRDRWFPASAGIAPQAEPGRRTGQNGLLATLIGR